MEELKPLRHSTKNYTSIEEMGAWWWYFYKFDKSSEFRADWLKKVEFRQRRSDFHYHCQNIATRIGFQKNNDIGAFCRLTNSYAIVGNEYGSDSTHFADTLKGDSPHIPIITTSVSSCNVVGRLCVGNSKGLLVPDTINEAESSKLRQELPDSVELHKIDEKLSALGNVIVCNDKVALIHPEINKETEEVIGDALQVEVFRTMIGSNPLVGTHCILNNSGGLINPDINQLDLENLSALIQLPLTAGTVNFGCKGIASGLIVNDSKAYAGMKTNAYEFSKISSAFCL